MTHPNSIIGRLRRNGVSEIEAKFSGRCGCGEWIEAGERVGWHRVERELICRMCMARDIYAPPSSTFVCQMCFLVRNVALRVADTTTCRDCAG